MRCKKCGNEIEENGDFCGFCGEKIEAITEESTKNQDIQPNVKPAEMTKGKTVWWNELSKKSKIAISIVIILFIIGGICNINKKNSNEYKLYEIWCKSIKSQWIVHNIEDFDRIEINKEEDDTVDDDTVKYNAIINITAENIMEEKINKKVYCYGLENKEGKIVKKMCGCFLHREKEQNKDFADNGYMTKLSAILKDIKELLPKGEISQSKTNNEQTNRDYSDLERDDFAFEANNNAKDDSNSYNYQYDQPEQPDTNNDINDFDKEEREYAKKQRELSRQNYKNAMAVLNKIESAVNKGDLGSYDEIYALYEQTIKTADFTNGTYNMKSNVETVLSSYQEYCSESGNDDISTQNREFHKQTIHRLIAEFKEQWQDLNV